MSKRKTKLKNLDMPRHIEARGGWVKAKISALTKRVTKEDTSGRTRFEFIGGVRSQPWIAETSKKL